MFDIDPSLDQLWYHLFFTIATLIWVVERTIFSLAYQLDQLRLWLLDHVFPSAYQELIDQLALPIFEPLILIALILFSIVFLLTPLLGRGANMINLRQVLLLALTAPTALILAGPLLRDLEYLRLDVGQAIGTVMRTTIPVSIGGIGNTQSMAPIAPLYQSNQPICGQQLPDHSAQTDPNAHQLVDFAAAIVWVTASDIHCPERPLPEQFYLQSPDGPGFAREGGANSANDIERDMAVQGIQAGIVQLLLGLLPAIVVTTEILAQLGFTIALLLHWLSLPIVLMTMIFMRDSALLRLLLRSVVEVLFSSWRCTMLLSLVFACMQAAALNGNALALASLSIAAFLVMRFVLRIAIQSITRAVSTFGQTASHSIGMIGIGSGALLREISAPTGAERYQVARTITGSRTYAAASVLGQIAPLASFAQNYSHNPALRAGAKAGQTALTTPALVEQARRDALRLAQYDQREQHQFRQITQQLSTMWQPIHQASTPGNQAQPNLLHEQQINQPPRADGGGQPPQVEPVLSVAATPVAPFGNPHTVQFPQQPQPAQESETPPAIPSQRSGQSVWQHSSEPALMLQAGQIHTLPRRDHHEQGVRVAELSQEQITRLLTRGYCVQLQPNGRIAYWSRWKDTNQPATLQPLQPHPPRQATKPTQPSAKTPATGTNRDQPKPLNRPTTQPSSDR
ncbi:MAG: hypothetical protein Fur005_22330 [Roseiflexaceae bacterium]